jgi:hypothetical protein
MTPLNPAPRPLLEPLWGSTFDARGCDVQLEHLVWSIESEILDSFPNAQKTEDGKHWFIWSVTVMRQDPDGVRQETIVGKEGTYEEAIAWYNEAINALHNALHPPLCMKHALEIGYAFQDESIYSVKVRGSAKPQYLYGHEITSEVVCTADMIDWFQPDTHGDAEAMVNAWKE